MGVSLRASAAGAPAIAMAGSNTISIWGTVYSADGNAFAGEGDQRILIGASGVLRARFTALEIQAGGGLSVSNAGAIVAAKGIDITGASAAADSLYLFNSGSFEVGDVAVKGTAGADTIINTGTLRTTGNAALIDLGGGHDFYDGSLGVAIGTIMLGSGNDTAHGGAVSEVFSGGDGDDYIDGGAGIDTVDYSGATAGISVNLGTTTWQHTGQGQDLLLDIENITASALNDFLVGSTGDNVLGAGDGDDNLEGGLGTDVLDGGEGSDTARYTGSATAFVSLALTGPQYTVGYGYDTLIGIEHLDGGSGSDTLTGNLAANRLAGNSGNDSLDGGDGNDTLEGGAGNDTLKGGRGNDSLDGGAGGNTAVLTGNRADYTWTALATTTNPDGTTTISTTVTDSQGALRDGVDPVRNVRLLKFADTTVALTNQNPNSLALSATAISESTAVGTSVSTLTGADPDGDALTYALVSNAGGRFSLNGRSLVLSARLDYEAATQHSLVVKVRDAYGGEFDKTLTVTVGNVVETTPIARSGTSRNDNILGENGGDRLYGMAGNDTLSGSAGNDKLHGGAGNDVLFGGSGKDIFVFDSRLNVRSNIEWVYDFKPSDDTIYLSRGIFSKIASKGTLSANAFVVGDRVYDKYDRIIYLKSAGALFYDPDGTGPAQAIQFATIGKNLPITNKDFVII
jgi:Ca2+-binding RTX toxin-like protein